MGLGLGHMGLGHVGLGLGLQLGLQDICDGAGWIDRYSAGLWEHIRLCDDTSLSMINVRRVGRAHVV